MEDREGKSGKIYIFPNMWDETKSVPYKDEYGSVVCAAVSDDGVGLGNHLSSNKKFAKHDMGVASKRHHDGYKKYYPAGFEIIWLDSHEDLPEGVVKKIKERSKE